MSAVRVGPWSQLRQKPLCRESVTFDSEPILISMTDLVSALICHPDRVAPQSHLNVTQSMSKDEGYITPLTVQPLSDC